MELKEGMCIRYRWYNIEKIAKIDFITQDELIDEELICLNNDRRVFKSEILKASDDITDLIKSGDVIETPKGIFKVGYIENNVIYTDDSKIIACLRKDEHLCFENTTIKSIVTKEQFNSVKYEV